MITSEGVPLELEELRERYRKMSDEKLLECGRAARFMCSGNANFGSPIHPSGFERGAC
jgi:hypothetical protein